MTQTVVSTGASAGTARATAGLYGAQGASAGLIARGTDRPHGAAEDVIEAGRRALPIPSRRGGSRLTVAGRCRTADPGWLLRNAIQDQHTGPAGRSREKSASTVTTVRTLVRR